jgi:hypothetical protein
MTLPNGHDPSTATIPAPASRETIQGTPEMPQPIVQPLDIATRAKLRAREHFQQNRFVIIGAGALVIALLIFVATSIPHKSSVQCRRRRSVLRVSKRNRLRSQMLALIEAFSRSQILEAL